MQRFKYYSACFRGKNRENTDNAQRKKIFISKQHIFCRFAGMKRLVLDKDHRIAIHFLGKGIGPGAVPLVLLHGFCEDSALWDSLLPGLSEIPIIAIDLPGFGGSDAPIAPNLATYAQAVFTVLDSLDLPRCVLVGHSLGGYIALEFAARYGHWLSGLGLFHAHPFPDDEQRKITRMRGIDLVRSGKRDLYVAQLFPNLFTPTFAKAQPQVLKTMIARGREQSAEGIIAALQAMKERKDHQDTLKNIKSPVLFLLGAEDSLVPVDQAWKAAMLPDIAMVEVLDGVAHMGMFEARDSSVGVLRRFYELCTGCFSGRM